MLLDGEHRSQYDASMTDVIVGEAAALIKSIGLAAHHLTLIGGVVPGLLLPTLDPGTEPHIGTKDIDLCLSVAIVEGSTGEYEGIERGLRKAGFAAEESWRWRGGQGNQLIVEFFCPAGPNRAPGQLFRPRASESPRAKKNLGGTLSALALESGKLVSEDVEVVSREIVLPDNKGRQTTALRVTGIAAFLATKASALRDRDKPKDAYDVIWLLEAWPGGLDGAARAVRERPIFGHPDMDRALLFLEDQFRDLDSAGARAYARFMARPGDDLDLLARQARGAVREFLRSVR